MYKLLLSIGLALAVTAFVGSAEAKPSTKKPAIHHVIKKHIKHKKINRHKKINKTEVAPAVEKFVRIYDDNSASGFFSNEQLLKEFNNKSQLVVAKELDTSRDDARQKLTKGCSWFSCSEQANVVMAEANVWIGKHGKADKKELKKLFSIEFNEPIDPTRTAWCAAFANAILRRTGHETTHSLMARSFLHWGVGTHAPTHGDIVVLKRGKGKFAGHVGFFEGYEWFEGVQYVKVLGGNTDHAVQVGYFPVSAVLGFRKVA